MNPNATITDEQFKAYLKKVRDMVEGPTPNGRRRSR